MKLSLKSPPAPQPQAKLFMESENPLDVAAYIQSAMQSVADQWFKLTTEDGPAYKFVVTVHVERVEGHNGSS